MPFKTYDCISVWRGILILILILTLPAVVAYLIFGKKVGAADTPQDKPLAKPAVLESQKTEGPKQ